MLFGLIYTTVYYISFRKPSKAFIVFLTSVSCQTFILTTPLKTVKLVRLISLKPKKLAISGHDCTSTLINAILEPGCALRCPN